MKVTTHRFSVQNHRNKPMFHDVTEQVKKAVAACGVNRGIATVYSQHTTCSVLIQEDSNDDTLDGTPYLMQDLLNVLEKLAPKCWHEGQYLHPGPAHLEHATRDLGEQGCWSLNTDAHLRSCLLGRSETIPIVDSALVLGQFGHIYFADFDSVRQRERTVMVQIVGE